MYQINSEGVIQYPMQFRLKDIEFTEADATAVINLFVALDLDILIFAAVGDDGEI